jgi:hypothetical protein
MRHLLIVDALEEAPETHPITRKAIVGTVLDGGNPPYDLPASHSQEEFTVAMPIEGIPLSIERVAHRHPERRHPLRVIFLVVEAPGEIDEAAKIAAGRDGADLDGHSA